MRETRLLRDVRRSKKYADMIGRLGSKDYKPENVARPQGAPIFGTIRELMCFAAVLGFVLDRFEPLQSGDIDENPVPEVVFLKEESAVNTIRLTAMARTKDPQIFSEDRVDEMVSIFEAYANGGFAEIKKFMDELPTDVLGADAIMLGLAKHGLIEIGDRRKPGNPQDLEF